MTVSKRTRQSRILEIVRREAVESQESLAHFLRTQGIDATQSTLSRDVRELGLVKIRGVYHQAANGAAPVAPDSIRRSIQQLVMRTDSSGNIVVLKTAPGNGHALGVVVDSAQWPEVVGTVAGDDTVFVLLRSPRVSRRLLKRIEDYVA